MEIFSGLSDNQTALVMCGAALLVCGSIMSLSHFIGRAGRPDESVAGAVEAPHEDDSQRKAA